MRFARKFARSFAKSFSRGFAGSSGGLFDILSKYYQYVFTTRPDEIITKDDLSYYDNFGTGGSDVDLQIGNTQVLTLDGVGSYVDSVVKVQGGQSFSFSSIVKVNAVSGIFTCGANSDPAKGITMRVDSNTIFRLHFSDGISRGITLFTFANLIDNILDITFEWSGVTGEVATLTINGDTQTTANTKSWVGDSEFNGSLGTYDVPVQSPMDGQFYYAKLDNYFEYNFQEATGTVIQDRSGNGNDATLIGAVQSEAWGTKSDEASPVLQIHGGSKYYNCITAGTTATLASPDGSNVGDDVISHIAEDWVTGTGWTSYDDRLEATTANDDIYEINKLTIGSYYLFKYELYDYIAGQLKPLAHATLGKTRTANGFYTDFILCTGGTNVSFLGITFTGKVRNISVQEVTAIPAYGEWEFALYKGADTNTAAINFIQNSTGNAVTGQNYNVGIDGNEAIFFRRNLVPKFKTKDNYVAINIHYKIKAQRNKTENQHFTGDVDSFRLLIKGGSFGSEYIVINLTDGSGNNPVTDSFFTETKFLVIDNDATDEFSHASKDGVHYDVDHFSDDMGVYKTRNSIGITNSLDADGNELEYQPNNGFWNSGNDLLNADDDGLNSLYGQYPALNVLANPNRFDFDDIVGIDLTGIPEDDFRLTKSADGKYIKGMATQPYDEALKDVNGQIVYDSNGEKIYPLKY